jgi:predicted NBD/HSP70 family sugar kinase
VLTSFTGEVRRQLRSTYRWPVPAEVFGFLRHGLRGFLRHLGPERSARVAGIGIAMPHEIWNWHEAVGAPPAALDAWRGLDVAAEVAGFTALPVLVENDGTAACRAEHVLGRGREFRDFAYLFIGSFIGGGVVLNHSVYEGPTRNAGAFGSLPARGPEGGERQLIDTASLFLLEDALTRLSLPADRLWTEPQDWSGLEAALGPWVRSTARQAARAALMACAVIDFEAVLIDGAFRPRCAPASSQPRGGSSAGWTGAGCRPSESRKAGSAATPARWGRPRRRSLRATCSTPTGRVDGAGRKARSSATVRAATPPSPISPGCGAGPRPCPWRWRCGRRGAAPGPRKDGRPERRHVRQDQGVPGALARRERARAVGHEEHEAAARHHLLHVRHGLVEKLVVRRHDDHRDRSCRPARWGRA